MIKKIVIVAAVLVVVAVALIFGFSSSSSSNERGFTVHKVEKGNVLDKATAIGQIEPEREVVVKSQISGIVSKIHVEVGDKVDVNDPLFDISPQPTPLEFADAKRQVELQQVGYENAKRNYNRVKGLFEKNLVSQSDLDEASNLYDQSKVKFELAKERLSLIDKGKTNIAGRDVENIIRSQIKGTVLMLAVDEGDPVVPLTSYQSGTELMILAAMDSLIFRGTVDEIDVGKLKPDMNVKLQVGAIPNDTIVGLLYKISPKARKENNTTVFDVEVKITSTVEKVLRAGYSANAEVIVAEKNDVLVIPERLVTFSGDSCFVNVEDSTSEGATSRIPVAVGLSDGINIEVTSGLTEGQEIVELPPRTIE